MRKSQAKQYGMRFTFCPVCGRGWYLRELLGGRHLWFAADKSAGPAKRCCIALREQEQKWGK